MANLTPVSSFDDVYQLEEADPVQGGAGGVSNRQAQSLVNRTKWLKEQLGLPYVEDKTGSTVGCSLAHTPVSDAAVEIYVNRVPAFQGKDYILSGKDITFTPAVAVDAEIMIRYRGKD